MRKTLIILIIFLILIIIGGAAGLFWYLNQKDTLETQKIEKSIPQKDDILSQIGPLYPLKPFTVNLQTPDEKDVYLNATISLELSDKTLSNELDAKIAVVRNDIIDILSSYSQDIVMSQKGKKEICDKITKTLNKILKDGQIRNVYIINFIIQ